MHWGRLAGAFLLLGQQPAGRAAGGSDAPRLGTPPAGALALCCPACLTARLSGQLLPPFPATDRCVLDTTPLFPAPCGLDGRGLSSDLQGYSWPGCICLLLCQSCILNHSFFLSSALLFLPLYLEILVVFSHLAKMVRLRWMTSTPC